MLSFHFHIICSNYDGSTTWMSFWHVYVRPYMLIVINIGHLNSFNHVKKRFKTLILLFAFSPEWYCFSFSASTYFSWQFKLSGIRFYRHYFGLTSLLWSLLNWLICFPIHFIVKSKFHRNNLKKNRKNVMLPF